MKLLTTVEAAALLSITPESLRLAVHRKRITPAYKGLFEPAEVGRYAASRKVGRPPKP